MSKSTKVSKLPNAPLVEVVFEMRWNLEGDSSTIDPLKTDPGYPILLENFINSASKQGFKYNNKMNLSGLMGYSVDMRLFKNPSKSFPIWQIGPGVFAVNEAANYEWNIFKKLACNGVKTLLKSYPEMKSFSLEPNLLELRYMNSFNSSFVPHNNIVQFIDEFSNFKLELPLFLEKPPLANNPMANLFLEFPVSNMKDTHFSINIANATSNNEKTILLVSKIVTKSTSLNLGKTFDTRIKRISHWLEKAHDITSPFFRESINDNLMSKFQSQ